MEAFKTINKNSSAKQQPEPKKREKNTLACSIAQLAQLMAVLVENNVNAKSDLAGTVHEMSTQMTQD